MNAKKPGPRFLNIKNILIIILLCIALGEGFLLLRRPDRGPSPPPEITFKTDETGQAVHVAGMGMDPAHGRYLLVAFDSPVDGVHRGLVPSQAPATVEPSVSGTWTWLSPYMLRFEPKDGFAQAKDYAVTLLSGLGETSGPTLAGETTFHASFGTFEVTRLTAHFKPAPQGGAMVEVRGQAVFNRNVDPKALADHIALIDPLTPDKPVAVSLTTSYPTKTIGFVSDPVEKKKEPRNLKLVITPGVHPEKGDITLTREAALTLSVALDPHLRLRGLKADAEEGAASIRIGLSTPVTANEATASRIRITPGLNVNLAADGADLVLSGPFEPGTSYQIALQKGLVAADGAVLDADTTRSVRIPDLAPTVDFKDQGMFLARNGYRNIAIKSVNTNAARLIVDRVYFNNLFPLFSMEYSAFDDDYSGNGVASTTLGDRLFDNRIPVTYKNNVTVTTPVNLEKYIQGHEPGLYRVALTVPGNFQGFQRLILVTDIGIVAKKGRDDLLVFAASTTTLEPLAGASVRVLSRQNQELVSGRTDAQGLMRAKIDPKVMTDKQPYLIIVQKGPDTSFLLYDRFQVDTTGLDVSGAVIPTTGYTAFVYGERDIYRPGETLQGLAVIRDTRLGLPPSMPVTIRLSDPQGRKLGEHTAVTGAQGMVTLRQPLPPQTLTGAYLLEVVTGGTVIGQYRFRVEEFVPDRISVKVKAEAASAGPGEDITFGVNGRYLFGAPGSDLPVEAKVRLVKAAFAPKGFEAYTFGDPEKSFEATDVFTQSGTLDSAGTASFAASLPGDLTPPAALEAIITARVREGGGRGVTGLVRMPVHAYPAYPGLRRLQSEAATPGKAMTFDYVVVAPDGKPLDGRELTATLYRDTWQTVLRKGGDGSLRYESVRDPKTLASKTVTTRHGKGAVSFTPPSFGSYRLVVADAATGAACQLEFYAGGFGYSPWAMENPARLELKPDKTEYSSGETARFQVRAPFAGKMLVAVEGSDVHDVQLVTLTGNTGDIHIPIKPEYMPGVYVTATLVRKVGDVRPGSPSRAFGAVPIAVDRDSGRLALRVSAPETMRPDGKLTAEVDAPAGSIVTVAAVDEGILQLIAQKTADPFGAFYAKRQLQVDTFDTFSLLLPEVPPLMGKALAGGGDGPDDLSNFVRSQSPAARTVAFWSGPVLVGPTGKAQISFDIPEFQGQVRLMAVGFSGREFASSETRTTVKSPVVLLPSFPRFLSFDDSPSIPITVRNDTGADGVFDIGLNVTSGPLQIATPSKQARIANGATATVLFPAKAGRTEGMAACAVTVNGNNETSRDTAVIPIRSPLPARTATRSGALETQSLTVPELTSGEFLPATAKRDVAVGPYPLIRFTGNLKALLGYPYGCLEQTVSKAFPLLYFASLAKTLAPGVFEKASPAAMVQAALRRVTGMQLYNGGFSMWPGGDEPQAWMSLYATHFFVEAAAAGYQPDTNVVDQALNFAGETGRNADLDKPEGLKLAAYALYVQARAGRADIGTMDNLRDNYGKKLPPEARGLLGAAYAAVGNIRSAETLMAGPVPAGEARKATGGSLDSTLRDKALYLSALLDALPADPRLGSLAVDVARRLEGEAYPTTQENAFALLALGKFYARQKAKQAFSGMLYAGSGLLSDFSNQKVLSLRGLSQSGDLRFVVDRGFTPGACYYSVRTRGIPTTAGYKAQAAGLEIARSYLGRDGTPLALDALPQGTLVVVKFAVRATDGPVSNVVLENLLPAGLEVENPRLDTTEKLPWMTSEEDAPKAYLDLRDDRVLLFTDLADDKWHTFYALTRAVTPGTFVVPPAQAEAMYAPEVRASGALSRLTVTESAPKR